MGSAYMERAKQLFPALKEGMAVAPKDFRPHLEDPRVKQALKWPGTSDQFLHLVCPAGDIRLETLAGYLEVLEVFQLIDTNRSGGINQLELMIAMHKIPAVQRKLNVPPSHANALFCQIDTNNSGTISFVEFFRYCNASPLNKPFKPVTDYNHIIDSMFKRIDINGDGSISKDEFVRALKQDQEIQLELGWPGHMAETLFKFLDRDKSGDISSNEFKLFCRAQWLFNNIDVNRSGYIDAVELGVALTKQEIQRELKIPATRAKEVFTTMDQDGSGQVKFSEFFRWLAARGTHSPPREQSPQHGRGGYTGGQPQQPRPTPAAPAVPMKKSEQFTNIKKIGEGTFGLVYLVQHYSGEKLIKKVPKKGPGESTQEFKDRMAAVWDEAKMLEAYKHQNIVRYVDSYTETITDSGRDIEGIIIITEFCPGGDLRQYMTRFPRGKMPQQVAQDVMIQVSTAIEFLHRGRLLHRDLKPDNIFLSGRSDRPIIKIGDFGLVKQLGANDQPVAQTMCGTMQYMAPEILSGAPYGMPNDVWAVGCILHEVAKCDGSLAFNNPGQVVNCILPKGTPAWCAPLVNAILQKDPSKRPTIADVKAWLKKQPAAAGNV